MTSYTLSGWLAKRAADATSQNNDPPPFLVELYPGDPSLHWQHVLPGAKRAITFTELEAWRTEGLSEQDMVLRVNERFAKTNAQRIEGFVAWRDGERLERLREHEARRVARAQALAEFESALVAERLSRNTSD